MKNKDKRKYSKHKVILYFILEIIAIILLAKIIVYMLPYWVVTLIVLMYMIDPYSRFKSKMSDIKSKRKSDGNYRF